MRDYYDIYILKKMRGDSIDYECLSNALTNTANHRATPEVFRDWADLIKDLAGDSDLNELWERFLDKNDYAGELKFSETIRATTDMMNAAFIAAL